MRDINDFVVKSLLAIGVIILSIGLFLAARRADFAHQ